jgi:hypothetical protein
VIAVTHVWLEYPETGGKQEFPQAAAEAWRLRGWVDCDPPPEPDLLHDPLPTDESGGDVIEAELEAAEANAAKPDDDEQGQESPSTRPRRKRGEPVAEEE